MYMYMCIYIYIYIFLSIYLSISIYLYMYLSIPPSLPPFLDTAPSSATEQTPVASLNGPSKQFRCKSYPQLQISTGIRRGYSEGKDTR